MFDPFPVPDTIDAVRADIWSRWTRGSADRRSAFHTPAVGSVNECGAPDQRIMVLRKVDAAAGVLRFHTDVRSAKARQIDVAPSVNILGYDAGAKIQLRACGIATVVRTGPVADAAWAATSTSGRRSYLTIDAPGSVSEIATSGLPETMNGSAPTIGESEVGRANFAIVVVVLDRLEWLHLAASGHRRAAFTRVGEAWTGTWLVP